VQPNLLFVRLELQLKVQANLNVVNVLRVITARQNQQHLSLVKLVLTLVRREQQHALTATLATTALQAQLILSLVLQAHTVMLVV
jgi:hypothetical protein